MFGHSNYVCPEKMRVVASQMTEIGPLSFYLLVRCFKIVFVHWFNTSPSVGSSEVIPIVLIHQFEVSIVIVQSSVNLD